MYVYKCKKCDKIFAAVNPKCCPYCKSIKLNLHVDYGVNIYNEELLSKSYTPIDSDDNITNISKHLTNELNNKLKYSVFDSINTNDIGYIIIEIYINGMRYYLYDYKGNPFYRKYSNKITERMNFFMKNGTRIHKLFIQIAGLLLSNKHLQLHKCKIDNDNNCDNNDQRDK